MIEALVNLLKPVFVPILRLKMGTPELPEGTSLVRHLRPVQAWLTYRYLGVMLGTAGQLFGALVGAAVLLSQRHLWSVLLAVLVLVVEAFVLGLALVTTRVDYELRHYLVGDRSLRVSMGAWTHHEATLSYANVQNLEVTQGPVERLFGFKSLTVSTAGVDLAAQRAGMQSSNVVTLMGLENADELRELILGMLKHHRGGGVSAQPKKVEARLDATRLAEVRDAALALRDAARARQPKPAAG